MKWKETIDRTKHVKPMLMHKINEHTLWIATEDSIYSINLNSNKLEEVEFVKASGEVSN